MPKNGFFPNASSIRMGAAELGLPVRSYGSDLARRLGLPVHVYLSSDASTARSVSDLERERIRHDVPGAVVQAHVPKGPSGGTVITITKQRLPGENTLDPKFEYSFDRSDKRRILVPLGQHASGLRALNLALRFALATGSEILLYHTSWHKSGVTSNDPWHHLSPASQSVLFTAQARCRAANITTHVVIETSARSPRLDRAVVKAVYTYECNLIVLARGDETLVGSYADSIRNHSLVPILIAADSYGQKTAITAVDDMNSDLATGSCPFTLLNSSAAAPMPSSGWSSYAIMGVSFLKYLLQMLAFFWAWRLTRVEIFLAQVFHMGSDVVQSLLNMWVTHDSRKPTTREFPFGRKNGPVIANLLTGLTLWGIAGKLVYDSASGFFHAGQHQHYPWILWVITGVSAVASLIVGRLQIKIGKANGDPAVEGDGHETISDALIDVAAFLGTLAMAIFQISWIEHLLGVVVALFIVRTGYELVRDGWKTLNQHTIGLAYEDAIISICQRQPGIARVTVAETFAIGTTAVVNLRLTTYAKNGEMAIIQEVLETEIRNYLAAIGFAAARINLQSELISDAAGRIAIAVVKDRFGYAVAEFEVATAFLICDQSVAGGDDRVTVEEVQRDSESKLALLARKHVRTVYVWRMSENLITQLGTLQMKSREVHCRNPASIVPSIAS